MKVVRVAHGEVQEVIPAYALPVEQWYGEEFAASCVEAPDEVEQGWVYDASSGAFSPPVDQKREPEPTYADIIDILLGVV